MIVLSKKRIWLITSMVVVAIFMFVIQSAHIDKKTVPTVSLPVSNKVIVLDARPW